MLHSKFPIVNGKLFLLFPLVNILPEIKKVKNVLVHIVERDENLITKRGLTFFSTFSSQ